jgi:hypothetical protein
MIFNKSELNGKIKQNKKVKSCVINVVIYVSLCVLGAEMKEKAGAAADAAKDKAQEVKNAADKKADEIKPKVNEAVNDTKKTGMYLTYTLYLT